jgi:hypothetical protein
MLRSRARKEQHAGAKARGHSWAVFAGVETPASLRPCGTIVAPLVGLYKFLGWFMYGLKPVPFMLKPVPFMLKPVPFMLRPAAFMLKPAAFTPVLEIRALRGLGLSQTLISGMDPSNKPLLVSDSK